MPDLPAGWVYGVDASYDHLSLGEARLLRRAGVKVFVQCLWTGLEQPPNRTLNLRNALLGGIPVLAGYISISANGQPGSWHVIHGRAGLPNDLWERLSRVPVDVELPGLTFAGVADALEEVSALGKPKDVYTNFNTWASILHNPDRPDGVGLWNAYWDGDPDVDFSRLPFGSWSPDEVWGEQWSGGAHVEGVYIDRNTFRAAAFPELAPAPDEPAPAEDRPSDSLTADGRLVLIGGLTAAATALAEGRSLQTLSAMQKGALRATTSDL